ASRRRHTRSKRDWSSDVWSSDLKQQLEEIKANISQQIKDIDGSYDKVAFYAILLYLGESKLFASNKELAILDRDIIQLNSKENSISIRRTKMALDKLEKLGWIRKINSRPKQHEIILK